MHVRMLERGRYKRFDDCFDVGKQKSERERMEAKVNDNSVVLRNGKKCDMDGRMKRLSKRLSTFICDIKDDVFGNSRSEECKAESEPEDVRDVIRL
ncbi:hypothetical protein QYM36_005135, partial [Artemia franciscana]